MASLGYLVTSVSLRHSVLAKVMCQRIDWRGTDTEGPEGEERRERRGGKRGERRAKKRAADLAESALCDVQWVDATVPCGIPAPLFHRCARISTYLCVYNHANVSCSCLVSYASVYVRVRSHRWSYISPVCPWSKLARFCSPPRSLSTLVKGLRGESNTLRPLRPVPPDPPCRIRQKETGWRCFV